MSHPDERPGHPTYDLKSESGLADLQSGAYPSSRAERRPELVEASRDDIRATLRQARGNEDDMRKQDCLNCKTWVPGTLVPAISHPDEPPGHSDTGTKRNPAADVTAGHNTRTKSQINTTSGRTCSRSSRRRDGPRSECDGTRSAPPCRSSPSRHRSPSPARSHESRR